MAKTAPSADKSPRIGAVHRGKIAPAAGSPGTELDVLTYRPSKGVDDFVQRVCVATPMQLVDVERRGVHSRFVKDLSSRIGIPAVRLFSMLGIPKATLEKKFAAGEAIGGSAGHAAVAMARLIAKAQQIVADSTAPEAKAFDAAKWLGQWLEHPQPALGGRKPAELIGTPTGAQVVARLLGSLESGACQ